MDRITQEVIRSGLYAVAREMKATMSRTAASPIIHSGGDSSAAVFDADMQLIAQGNDIPTMLGSSILSTRACVEAIGAATLRPGDVIIGNDTYLAGGNHQPDVQFTRPVFWKDEIVAYVITRAHWPDIGGSTPGSVSIATLDVFGEGVRIPPILLYRQDRLDEPLANLIIHNTRNPSMALLDIQAQYAGCRVGERRIQELVGRYGPAAFRTAAREALDYSERLMRMEIERIPDGTWRGRDLIETVQGGLWSGVPAPVEVAITVAGDRISFDFEGSAPQVRGGVNCPLSVTLNSVWYVVKAVTDPAIPINQGCYRPIEVAAPAGSIVNCSYPASVVSGNYTTSLRLVDMLLTTLAPALPQRVVAQSHGTVAVCRLAGIDPVLARRRALDRVHVTTGDMTPGGYGARPDKDGINGVRTHVGNAGTQSVEFMEHTAPILVESWAILPDTGGAGRFRGGCAVERVCRVDYEEATMSVSADRETCAPIGLFGGKAGALFRCEVTHPDGRSELVPAKGPPLILRQGTRVSLRSAGAGGYGDPAARDPARIQADIRNGYVTEEGALADYGVAVTGGKATDAAT